MILKVAYIGTGFCGSQIQRGSRTVEGELGAALKRICAIDSKSSSNLRILSRTDRGVSAAGNLAVVEPGDGFDIDRLNHELPGDIFVLGKSEGKIGYPVMKHYTYLLGKDMIEKMDMGRLRHVAGLFSGKHDFINFAKSDKSSEKLSVRTIEVKADEINNIGGIGFIVLHFYGAGFLWQMIRRIVQCMYDYSTGKISEKRVRDFIDVKIKRNYVPAVAENLVLIDIDAGLRFNHSAKMKRQTREKMGLLEKELFFFGNLFN